MRRSILALTLVLVFLATGALAQPPGRGGGSDLPGLPGPLLHFLDLTEEQRMALRDLGAQLRDTVQPLAEQKQDLAAQLGEALGSDDPDAQTVGELILANRALDGEIQAAQRAFGEAFFALLSDEQKLRYQAFQAALRTLEPRDRDRPRGGQVVPRAVP